jgi:PKD repeat protein
MARIVTSAGAPLAITAASTTYTMTPAVGTVKADAVGGAFTVTLPDATVVTPNVVYAIKRMNATGGNVTVAAAGAQTIDGVASVPLLFQWQGISLISDGTNWLVRNTTTAKHPPVASFVPTMVDVTFSAVNNSYDPDGDTLTYLWAFGDGTTSTSTTPNHTYAAVGNYTVTLTATDGGGLSGTSSTQVTATAAPADRVPYSTTAPVNKTMSEKYPGGVPLKAQSFIEVMREERDFNTGPPATLISQAPWSYFANDTTQYTYPVYIVDSSTPTGLIEWTGSYTRDDGTQTLLAGGGGYTGNGAANVPANIKFPATVKPAVGSDAQVIFWNPTTGEEFNFWGCVTDGSGNWGVNGSGRHVCSNWSYLSGEKTNPGKAVGSPDQYGSRGAGIMYLYGMIRPWEITAGVIRHEVAVAFSTPANTFVSPATKSDGKMLPTTHLPEGALIYLRSDFPITDLADPTARIIATAFRDYGLRVIDNSGTPKVYLESDNTATGGATVNWAGAVAANLLREIPIEDFRAVDPSGSSSLRESDIRWDTAVSADPLSTLPAVTGSVAGGIYNAGAAVGTGAFSTTSQTPVANEVLLCVIAMRSNNADWVNTVTGNGQTWKLLRRRMEPSNSSPNVGLSQNLVHEIWACRATSPSAGAVSVTLGNGGSNAVAVQAIRLTPNATIGKIWTKDVASVPHTQTAANSANPSITIRGTTANSLIVGALTYRAGTLSVGTGETAIRLNDSQGASGTVAKLSTMTKPGGGDITLTETLASTEWLFTAIEIT